MGLEKCRECSKEISNKAKVCPHCGAKRKKNHLPCLFILLIIVVVIGVASKNGESSHSRASYRSTTSSSEALEKTLPSQPEWKTTISKDEMTGKFSAYAYSPTAYPSPKMEFPYGDVSSWMAVGCNVESKWVYFGFSDQPNLTNDETESGYNLITTRIKWNDQVETTTLSQDWGSKFLRIINDKSVLTKVAKSNKVLLELQWYGQRAAYFEYSLKGSSKALQEIFNQCEMNK